MYLKSLVMLFMVLAPLYFIFQPAVNTSIIGVVFPSKMSQEEKFLRIIQSGSKPIRNVKDGLIWIVYIPTDQEKANLKKLGIWTFIDPIILKGCGFI